jgi:YihY family inner membrane protein
MDIPRDARQWRLIDLLERYLPGPTAHLVSWARSDESLSTAASLAFFALVSLPPTALIGFWAAGLMAGDERISQLGEQLAALAPAEMGADGMLLQLVEVAGTLGWTSVLAALWPATAYGAGLARAFDRLTPTGRRRMDGLRGRVLVVVLIALLPLLILGALLVVLFLPQLLGEQVVVRVLGLALAGLIAVAALTAILALLYGLFSPADVGVGAAFRGAGWAAGAITVVSIGYVVYLRLGADFEERYGSSAFAAVILLGLWLYLANSALIVGYKTALLRAGVQTWRGEQD